MLEVGFDIVRCVRDMLQSPHPAGALSPVSKISSFFQGSLPGSLRPRRRLARLRPTAERGQSELNRSSYFPAAHGRPARWYGVSSRSPSTLCTPGVGSRGSLIPGMRRLPCRYWTGIAQSWGPETGMEMQPPFSAFWLLNPCPTSTVWELWKACAIFRYP